MGQVSDKEYSSFTFGMLNTLRLYPTPIHLAFFIYHERIRSMLSSQSLHLKNGSNRRYPEVC